MLMTKSAIAASLVLLALAAPASAEYTVAGCQAAGKAAAKPCALQVRCTDPRPTGWGFNGCDFRLKLTVSGAGTGRLTSAAYGGQLNTGSFGYWPSACTAPAGGSCHKEFDALMAKGSVIGSLCSGNAQGAQQIRVNCEITRLN
jgi:hypothetical protein